MNTPTTQRDKWYGKWLTAFGIWAAVMAVLSTIVFVCLKLHEQKVEKEFTRQANLIALLIVFAVSILIATIWTGIQNKKQ